jgi:protein-tyrosine phosphatase
MKRILFVCLGNICRSPTAAGVFAQLAAEAGRAGEFATASAGTVAHHVGEGADPRSARHAAGRGYDLSRHRARQLRSADFEAFDLLLAMDRANLETLRRSCPPAHAAKLKLFLDFAPGQAAREVPDPYSGGPEGFEQVIDLVEAASRGLLATLDRAEAA